MPNFTENFVEQYKAIFALQKEKTALYSKDYFEIISTFLMIISIFLLVGFFTRNLNNIYYAFLVLNSTTVFIYYLIRLKTYKRLLNQINQDIAFHKVLSYDLIQLLVVLMTFQTFLFFIYFRALLATSFFVGMILLTIVLNVINRDLNNKIAIKQIDTVYKIGWLLFAYIVLFYWLPYESLLIQYFISSGIMFFIFLYKTILNNLKGKEQNDELVIGLLIIVISIMMIFNFLNYLYAIGFLIGEDNYLEYEILKMHQHLLLSRPVMMLVLVLIIQVPMSLQLDNRGLLYA
jgi:hypothetical protein